MEIQSFVKFGVRVREATKQGLLQWSQYNSWKIILITTLFYINLLGIIDIYAKICQECHYQWGDNAISGR